MTDARAARGARIGGRWAVSARAVMVLAAFALMGALIEGLGAPGTGMAAAGASWAASMAAVALLTAIADATVFQHRRQHPVPAWWVATFGAVAGITWAAVSGAVLRAMAPTGAPGWAPSLLAAAALSALIVAGCAAIFTEIDDNRMRREAMMRQMVELRAQDRARAALGDAMRGALLGEIATATSGIRAQLDQAQAAGAAGDRADFARGLANAVDRDLRPLSRRLDAATADPIPRADAATSARMLLAALRVQPMATGAAIGLVAMLFLSRDLPASQALWRGALSGGVAAAALGGVRWLVARRPAWARWEVPAGAVLASVALLAQYVILQALLGPGRGAGPVVGIVVLTVAATVLVGIGARTLAEGTPRTRELGFVVDERQLEALAANREFVRVSRELARYVHGTLQSHLLATAFAIDDATRTGDPAVVDAAIDAARRVFDAGPGADPPLDLEMSLDRQAALWDGFVAVGIDVRGGAGNLSADDVRNITQVAEEAISNARKHGEARAVDVRVQVDAANGLALVRAADDGSGPIGGAPGMGSALLDEATGGDWRLDAGETRGAVLTARVPIGGPGPPAPGH